MCSSANITFYDLVALEDLRGPCNARWTSFGRVAPWANGRHNPGAGETCAHDIRFETHRQTESRPVLPAFLGHGDASFGLPGDRDG
jgi:hypothetical protein